MQGRPRFGDKEGHVRWYGDWGTGFWGQYVDPDAVASNELPKDYLSLHQPYVVSSENCVPCERYLINTSIGIVGTCEKFRLSVGRGTYLLLCGAVLLLPRFSVQEVECNCSE